MGFGGWHGGGNCDFVVGCGGCFGCWWLDLHWFMVIF